MVTFDRPEVRALRKWLDGKSQETKILEVDSWEVLARFAKEGLGKALVPNFVASGEKRVSAQNFDFTHRIVAFKKRPIEG
jgi:hypothetical protein